LELQANPIRDIREMQCLAKLPSLYSPSQSPFIHSHSFGVNDAASGTNNAVTRANNAVSGTNNAVNGTNDAVNGTNDAVNGMNDAVNGTNDAVNGANNAANGATLLTRSPVRRLGLIHHNRCQGYGSAARLRGAGGANTERSP
jgi:hypothetical protein